MATALCCCAIGSAFFVTARLACAGVTDAQLSDDLQGDDWAAYGRTHSEDHYSPLREIDRANVSRLSLAWYHDLDTGQRTDTQPLESYGTVYLTTGQSIVRALDARTGKLRWRFDPKVGIQSGPKLRSTWGVRGLALLGDRVFVGTTDGRLIALNAGSGTLAWSVQTLDKEDETAITGAPRAFAGKVVIGFSGGDRAGTRGALNCYDATSGKHLWRFYTVPGDPAKGVEDAAMKQAAATWSGKFWKVGGGGAVWNGITYDPELKRVYIGTGNANPWNPYIRNPNGLDNLYTASIVALDADTGQYVWHYQENPGDAWDYDAVADIELATLRIDGQRHRVLVHAPKNGFFYVIDRDSGKLLSADKYGKVTWAERVDLQTGRPVEAAEARYQHPNVVWPGNIGLHNWQAMAYSPADRLVYVPVTHMAANYNTVGIDPKVWQPTQHMWTSALGDTESGLPEKEFGSSLLAWDPVAKKEAWHVRTAGMWGGGTMATGGGLVFQGQLDGTFDAYDSHNGTLLWSFKAGVAALGAPISYRVDGRQYVTVLTGPPIASAAYEPDAPGFGWRYRDHPRRALTFTLDGKASLPSSPPPGPVVVLTGDPPADTKLAAQGTTLYGYNCTSCHGHNAVSGGSGPDLRASALVLSKDAFAAVVHGGSLMDKGMPQFPEFSPQQLEAMRQYIRSQAQGHKIVEVHGNGL
jgi:quinohemoprotein ethanol dehydrogenase